MTLSPALSISSSSPLPASLSNLKPKSHHLSVVTKTPDSSVHRRFLSGHRNFLSGDRRLAFSARAKPKDLILGNPSVTVEKGKYSYDVETLINKLSSLPPRGSIARCLDIFKNKLSLNDFALVFKEFAARGDWQRSLRLFKYMQRQIWCKPNEHIYTIMISLLGREGLLDKCSEVFDDMPSQGVVRSVFSYTALINAYGRNGQYETSLQFLDRMKKDKVSPSILTYNTVLNACARGGLEWEGLLGLFAEMRHEGIQPDLVTYNTLLSACAGRGLGDEAEMVFRTMNEGGIVPDITTYRYLVETFGKLDKLEKVSELLKEMESGGNLPDITSYNVLLEAYAQLGSIRESMGVFRQMQAAGCMPNAATYSILLNLYGRHGRYDDVRELFLEMKISNTEPDPATYNILIQVFGEGGYFKEVVTLFHDMVEENIEPNMETYEGLIYACGKGGLHEDAKNILLHMSEKGIVPSSKAYTGVIEAYGQAALYDEALVAFNTMNEVGSKPSVESYNSLIYAFARGGLYRETEAVLSIMGEVGAARNVHTFNGMIEAFRQGGQFEEAIKAYVEMEKRRCDHDEWTLEAVLSVYCVAGLVNECEEHFQEMKASGILPSVMCYCMMLAVYARNDRWDDANELLNEMLTNRASNIHQVIGQMIKGDYDDDSNWQMVEYVFDKLKSEGCGLGMRFYNTLLEALWWLGQKQRAVRVLNEATQRGLFPELFRKNKLVGSVDVHRMWQGGAYAAMSVWLNNMYEMFLNGEDLPNIATVVVVRGKMEKSSMTQDLPIAKAAYSFLEDNMPSSFSFPKWNKGRILCQRPQLNKNVGSEGWSEIETRFDELAVDGTLPKLRFAQCIGMDESSEFAGELFDALARRRGITAGCVSKDELREFWEQISDISFDARLQTFFDMVDKNADGRITEEEVKEIISLSACANRLSQIQERVEEYAALIMEELDPDNIGYIELYNLEMLLLQGPTQSTNLVTDSGIQSQLLSQKLVPTKEHNPIRRLYKRLAYFMEDNWKRIWVIALWILICLSLFTWKFIQYKHRAVFDVMGYCVSIAKGGAETLKFNMALILLPVCRNTITWLRSKTKLGVIVPFDDNINFHKVIAFGIMVGVGLHAGSHLTCDFPRLLHSTDDEYDPMKPFFGNKRPDNYWWFVKGTEGWTGVVMVALMVVAYTLAQPWFRRNRLNLPKTLKRLTGFNAFWYSHHLFVIVYILFIIHGYFLYLSKNWDKKTTWMYLAVPILLYACERLIRAFRSGYKTVRILKVAVYPGNVLALHMSTPQGFKYTSGQYIYVNCSAISPFQWHPFSITSAPGDDYLSIHIRTLGDWTSQLKSIFSKVCQPPSSEQSGLLRADIAPGNVKLRMPRLLIDGPYGAPAQDYKEYEVLLLVGLGIGATPLISIVKDVLTNIKQQKETEDHQGNMVENNGDNKDNKRKSFVTKRAYFYWITREQGSFEWFRGVMDEVAENDKDGVIELHNYCTSVYEEGDARSALITMLQSLNHAKNGVDIVSGTRVKTHFARPNWRNVFKHVAVKHTNQRVGVFYCGAHGLVGELKRLSQDFSRKTETKFDFHKENF